MPTVELSRKVIEGLMGTKLSTEELKDRISMLGTDLEGIEGDVITVEIFPNRPDLLSEQGFSRALASFIGKSPGLKKYIIKKSGEKVIVDKNLSKIRPYTVCAIVKKLSLNDEKIRELIQIQEKLHATFCRNRKKAAIGIYPLENIKMPIYFKGMKPEDIKFKPLESDKIMTGKQILEEHPKGREFAKLLDGLPLYPVFIDAKDDILSLTPIINSHLTGKITHSTKEAFIELSGFDLEYQKIGLNILISALIDMGAEAYSMEIVYPDETIQTPNLEPKKMGLQVEYVNSLLGMEFTSSEIKKYLERMGHGFEDGKVLVPAYRADILHKTDFVEDIAIAYGYENFKEEIPNIMTIGKEDKFEKFNNKIREILVGAGLIEVFTYHLIDQSAQTLKMRINGKPIKILDPVSAEYGSLRMNLLPSLLTVLGNNQHREFPQNIFESAVTFPITSKENDSGIKEETKLCVLFCHSDSNYTEARQLLEWFLRALGIDKAEFVSITDDNPNSKSYIPGRAANVVIKGDNVGILGEIHPQVLEGFGITQPVSALEVDLEALFSMIKE